MSRIVYEHLLPSRFIVGTVGNPGERAFFLQVVSDVGRTTVAVEKTQVGALSVRLREMIGELRRNKLASLDELSLPAIKDSATLDFPIDEDFQTGVIGITWDQEMQRVIIEAQALMDESEQELLDEDDISQIEDAPDLMRVYLRINQVRGFCDRADAVVANGRQPCPFCGLPIDPAGHLCPRANGYRR
jgi:uncharacterized repeat protein (TIGR03847 family)